MVQTKMELDVIGFTNNQSEQWNKSAAAILVVNGNASINNASSSVRSLYQTHPIIHKHLGLD